NHINNRYTSSISAAARVYTPISHYRAKNLTDSSHRNHKIYSPFLRVHDRL
ncbi:hypothetical protein COCMIDRAFT_97740, partial [Bipolaris oryzae ATCC 44560]